MWSGWLIWFAQCPIFHAQASSNEFRHVLAIAQQSDELILCSALLHTHFFSD